MEADDFALLKAQRWPSAGSEHPNGEDCLLRQPAPVALVYASIVFKKSLLTNAAIAGDHFLRPSSFVSWLLRLSEQAAII